MVVEGGRTPRAGCASNPIERQDLRNSSGSQGPRWTGPAIDRGRDGKGPRWTGAAVDKKPKLSVAEAVKRVTRSLPSDPHGFVVPFERCRSAMILWSPLAASCFVCVLGAHLSTEITQGPAPTPTMAPIQLEVKIPKMRFTAEAANSGEYEISVVLKNRSEEPVVVGPYLRLEIRDESGVALKPSRKLGRFGRRSSDCFLQKLQFDTIDPGKSVSRKVKLSAYSIDPEFVLAWKMAAVGDYELTFTYWNDTKVLSSHCSQECESHDNPESPWNRAWQGSVSAETTLRLEEPR